MSAVDEKGFIAKTHLSLNVSDVERSVQFYTAFFGVPTHKRRAGYANFDIAEPPLKLALMEQSPTPGAGSLNHMGIQVATVEQVQSARERLEQTGLVTFDEGDTVCCYARQDKVWVHDPDGNAWEIYVLLDDMQDAHEDDHDHDHSARGPVCCAPNAPCGVISAPITLTVC